MPDDGVPPEPPAAEGAPPRELPDAVEPDAVELRKEAYAMALYVAICLLATLTAVPVVSDLHEHVLGIIWGVTIGLAIAHWFAFRMSSRLVAAGRLRPHDVAAAGAQLAGAGGVALLATIPVLIVPDPAELEVAALILAAFIGLVGFAVARSSGTSRGRAVIYAVSVLLVAVAIVELKNRLAGH